MMNFLSKTGSGLGSAFPFSSFSHLQKTPPALAVSASLLGSILASRLASLPLEIWSELTCWAALLVAVKIGGRATSTTLRQNQNQNDRQHQHSTGVWRAIALWFVAVCLTSVTVYKTELGMVLLVPAITPLLLIAERLFGNDTDDTSGRFSTLIGNSIWGTILIAVLCTGSLVSWNFNNVAPAIGPMAALFFAFTIFTHRSESARSSRACRFFSSLVPSLDIHECLGSVVWRMLFLLGAVAAGDIYLFGAVQVEIAATASLGLAKALFWFFAVQAMQSTPAYEKLSLSEPIDLGPRSPSFSFSFSTHPPSWRIASTILTFGLLSTSDPFTQLTDLNALAVVAASLLTLTQLTMLLPPTRWTRVVWAVFALVPVVPFAANTAALWGFYPAPPHTLLHHEHPVEGLMRQAQAQFHEMLANQSHDVAAATNEYRRRYGRGSGGGIEPPPGFAQWFTFAHEMGAQIIDEYDMIHEALEPLRALSGKDIQAAMDSVYSLKGADVWRCNFKADTRQTTCTHPSRTFDRYGHDMFNALLGGGSFGGGVPNTTVHLDVDVTFLVNHLDEPRLLLSTLEKAGKEKYTVTDLEHKPVWDVLTKHCGQQPPSLNTTANLPPVDTFGIPFVTDMHAKNDLCQHPEYKDMHGIFLSPVSFPLIQGIAPILSSGTLSTMGDIVYPSPAYSEQSFMYDPATDVPWDQKTNTVYWAGSTTGAYADTPKTWRGYHRHRVVALAQNLEGKLHAYLSDEDGDGPVRRVLSPFLNGRLFDIAFTRVFQCEHRVCREMRSFFRPRPWAGRDDAMRSRLVFGVDGNGISGRYYKLVGSGSAPLKQTLLKEWHDERLVPWVHYFPVSQGMEEVPELVSYLTSPRGERAARTVAENGKRWSTEALRPADRAVYVYRLMLELARLQDPRRPAGSAVVPVGV